MNKSDPFGDVQPAAGFVTDSQSGYGERDAVAEEPVQADHVGAFLCATRMRLGGDLQEIARVLRIRYGYLVAIEDGRYEDLPGSAYSIGFVRAYADYLGLDGDEIVRRLRDESAGKVKATRFEFSAPSGDSGLPNGGLLAVAIGLGMVVYAAWYTISNGDRDAVDLIQEVPGRLAVLMNDESEEALAVTPRDISASQAAVESVAPQLTPPITEENVDSSDQEMDLADSGPSIEPSVDVIADADVLAEEPLSTESDDPESLVPADEEMVVASVETPTTEESEPGLAEPVQDNEESVSTDITPTPRPALPVAEAEPETAGPVELEVSGDGEREPISSAALPPETDSIDVEGDIVADRQIEVPVEQEVASLPDDSASETESSVTETDEALTESVGADAESSVQPASEPDEDIEEPTQQAAVQDEEGETPANAEDLVIELRAKSDSWIQVRDGDDLLLTGLLRQGEVYRVPDRNGLTLMTGNAGGLEVFVGGELMPPLGDEGVVRRGVPLSADRLRTGVAPG